MYAVEAEIVVCHPSITYLPTELIDSEWISIVSIPQLETEQQELQEARAVARKAQEYYRHVRITKSDPGGLRSVVA